MVERLASGLGAIVAAGTGARLHTNMIKHGGSPCRGRMTLAAFIRGDNVGTWFASGLGTVVT